MSLSDRWKHSRLRPKNTATYTQYRNWLSKRYHARGNGKAPLPDRIGQTVGSRTPGYRNRINPAHGRPRWTDRSPQHMARWRNAREQGRPATRADRNAANTDRKHGGTAVPPSQLRDAQRTAERQARERTARNKSRLNERSRLWPANPTGCAAPAGTPKARHARTKARNAPAALPTTAVTASSRQRPGARPGGHDEAAPPPVQQRGTQRGALVARPRRRPRPGDAGSVRPGPAGTGEHLASRPGTEAS